MAAFRDIKGHPKAVSHLQRAILSGHISHAYLIVGDAGSGKETLARAFSQTLQCTALQRMLAEGGGSLQPEDADACGVCRSCRRAAEDNHPDIIVWSREKPKTFSVRDARGLVADVQIRPYESSRKIYIVPDAHLMNAEAQNTLLKTLEEPPAYAVLLLLTDSAEVILETIRSRCVMISLETDAEAAGEEAADLALRILLHVREWNHTEVIAAVRDLAQYRLSADRVLDLFTAWYRDVLYFKASRDADGILQAEYTLQIREAAAHCSYEEIRNVLDAVGTARRRLLANVNFDLTMELLLLTMSETGRPATA